MRREGFWRGFRRNVRSRARTVTGSSSILVTGTIVLSTKRRIEESSGTGNTSYQDVPDVITGWTVTRNVENISS